MPSVARSVPTVALVSALAVTALLATTLSGCALFAAENPGRTSAPSAGTTGGPVADPVASARAIASRLSDADAIGQLMMPFVYGEDATSVSAEAAKQNQENYGVRTPAEVVAKYRLGGVMLTRRAGGDPTQDTNPASNTNAPDKIRALTAGLRGAAAKLPAGVPMMISTDQEHGTVTRVRNGVTLFPAQMAYGAANDPALAQRAATVSGAELRAIGITADFAPDADVLGSAGNTAIGSRSVGGDPKMVSAQVSAQVRGFAASGVASTLKHFPGHGHTATDSHQALPVLTQNRASLDANDLAPFRAGIAAGAPMVMSGHLDARAIDPGTPATLSRKLLTDVLRGQLGFRGVVVTDSMVMPPVTKKYGDGEAAVRAVLAGNDILLTPPKLDVARQALLAAVASGRLPRAQVNESVTRILTLRIRQAGQPAPPTRLASVANQATADQVAAKATTILRGPCSGALVGRGVSITGGSDTARTALVAALKRHGIAVGAGGTTVHLAGYLDAPADLKPADITVATDTPYILAAAKSKVLVATYGTAPASMTALAAVLAGKASAPGRSPVPVPGLPATAC